MSLTPDIINSFAMNLNKAAFKTLEYKEALKDYRRYGCRTPNPIPIDIDEELEYIYKKVNAIEQQTDTELLLL